MEKELNTVQMTLGIHKGDMKFSMQKIEVDGIQSRRNPSRIYDNFFMSLKEEENDNGTLMDIGFPYRYNPEMVVSDRHWMTCAEVVGIGEKCPYCEEVAK